MQQGGIHADYMVATITEVEALGLVTITHRGAYRGGAKNNPSTYRLNYLPWKFVPASGPAVYYAPLDQWKNYKKPARTKRTRMPLTGGATSYHPGGAFDGDRENGNTRVSAGKAEPWNATDEWKRSSITGSTKRGEGSTPDLPPSGSETERSDSSVARSSRVKTKNAGSVMLGISRLEPSAIPEIRPSRSKQTS